MPVGTLLSPGCDTCFTCDDPPPPECNCDISNIADFSPGSFPASNLFARLNMPGPPIICTDKVASGDFCFPMCFGGTLPGTGINQDNPPYTFTFEGFTQSPDLRICAAFTQGAFSGGFSYQFGIQNWRFIPDPNQPDQVIEQYMSTLWLVLYISNAYGVTYHQVDTELCNECFSGTLTFPPNEWYTVSRRFDAIGGDPPPSCPNWTSMELISTKDCSPNCAANCCDGLKAGMPNITSANKWSVGVAGGTPCFPLAIPWITSLTESPACTFQSTYAIGGGACFTDVAGASWFVLQMKIIITSTSTAGPKPCTTATFTITYERVSDGSLADQIYNYDYDYCTYTSGALSLSSTSHTFPNGAPVFPSVTVTALA